MTKRRKKEKKTKKMPKIQRSQQAPEPFRRAKRVAHGVGSDRGHKWRPWAFAWPFF